MVLWFDYATLSVKAEALPAKVATLTMTMQSLGVDLRVAFT